MSRRPATFAIVAATVQLVGVGYAGPLDSVSSELRKDLQCMMRVLKSEPLVSEAHIGFTNNDGWHHPYLAYRYRGIGVAFDTYRNIDLSGVRYGFIANLNGLTTTAGQKPDDLGTPAIIEKWKRDCGVDASAVFN